MPFKSEKQRRFLWAEHPDIAKRWAKKYPESNKDLPMYAHKDTNKDEKNAALVALNHALTSSYVNSQTVNSDPSIISNADTTIKNSADGLMYVPLPKKQGPSYAGEERESGTNASEKSHCAETPDNKALDTKNPVAQKLAGVLAGALVQTMANKSAFVASHTVRDMLAKIQGYPGAPMNLNLKRYAVNPAAQTMPPGFGMGQPTAQPQAQPQAQAAAQPQTATPAKTAAANGQISSLSPIQPITPPPGAQRTMGGQAGGKKSPSVDAIQMYGPMNMINGKLAPPQKTVINGNAAFGQKNSPDSMKFAEAKDSTPCSCGCGDTVSTCKCGSDCKCRKPGGSCYQAEKAAKLGLWDRIRAKKERGGKPAQPGDKDYPDAKSWKKVTAISEKKSDVEYAGNDPAELKWHDDMQKAVAAWEKKWNMKWEDYPPEAKKKKPAIKQSASSPAWQRSAGKNPEGGLNAKGRASYNKATGGNLKAPVTESNPSGERAKRQNSFCARMCGMKKHETGSDTARDPDSRINKSLSKWNCKCGSAFEFGKLAADAMAMPSLSSTSIGNSTNPPPSSYTGKVRLPINTRGQAYAAHAANLSAGNPMQPAQVGQPQTILAPPTGRANNMITGALDQRMPPSPMDRAGRQVDAVADEFDRSSGKFGRNFVADMATPGSFVPQPGQAGSYVRPEMLGEAGMIKTQSAFTFGQRMAEKTAVDPRKLQSLVRATVPAISAPKPKVTLPAPQATIPGTAGGRVFGDSAGLLADNAKAIAANPHYQAPGAGPLKMAPPRAAAAPQRGVGPMAPPPKPAPAPTAPKITITPQQAAAAVPLPRSPGLVTTGATSSSPAPAASGFKLTPQETAQMQQMNSIGRGFSLSQNQARTPVAVRALQQNAAQRGAR